MEGDIVQMGAYIGAGLACTGMGGAAIGVGHVVGNYISGALRNPSAAAGQTALVTEAARQSLTSTTVSSNTVEYVAAFAPNKRIS